MLKKLREIFLTQYIGAVLIALLGWQALRAVVTLIVQLGIWFFRHWNGHVVWDPDRATFPWDNLILSVVTVAIYVFIAYLLTRWLYPEIPPPVASATDAQSQTARTSMPRVPRLQIAWLYFKPYWVAAVSVGLIYEGTHDIIWPLKYHFINAIARLANPVIEKYLPGHLILAQYGQMPWRFESSYYVVGVIFIVVGVFFGLWAKVRIDRQPAP